MEIYKQVLSWITSFGAALVVATVTIDARYAHSDEIAQYKSDMRQFLIKQQQLIEESIKNVRAQNLDDQIFALRVKADSQKLDKVDQALLSRYETQRQALRGEHSSHFEIQQPLMLVK